MAVPFWEFILTDLTGVQIGPLLNADDRKIALPLGRIPTVNFTVPLYHSFASSLMDTDTLIKAYRNDGIGGRKLVFHGPVTAAEENGDSLNQTIGVTASGPFWRLNSRIIPGSDQKTGFKYPASGTADLGAIAWVLLDDVNGATNGYTGISHGVSGTVAQGVAWYEQPKLLGEAIVELSTGINSFEFDVRPTEATNVAQPWPQIGVLDVKPLIGGVTRSDAIFEYGTTRANVSSYKRQVDRAGMLNSGLILPPSWPNSVANGYTSTDATSQTTHGRFDDLVDSAGIEDAGLRQALADEHVAIRKNPRQIITFTPSINSSPSPFTDYQLGDYVTARAVVQGSLRFSGTFRIWGITFSLDKNGNESVELELQTP